VEGWPLVYEGRESFPAYIRKELGLPLLVTIDAINTADNNVAAVIVTVYLLDVVVMSFLSS
jgi:hypothetical protein